MDKLIGEFTKSEFYKRYKGLLLPSISLAICASLIGFVIVPQVRQFFETRGQKAEAEQTYKTLSEKVAYLQGIDKEVFADYINIALTAIPAKKDLPNALSQILYLITSNKLQVESLAIAGSGGDLESFSVKLDLKGDTLSFKNFINDLPKVPRIVNINALDLTVDKKVNQIQVSTGLAVYYQPLPEDIGKVDQPLPVVSEKEIEVLNLFREKGIAIPSLDGATSTASGTNTNRSDPFE